jgi:hypothetical protein
MILKELSEQMLPFITKFLLKNISSAIIFLFGSRLLHQYDILNSAIHPLVAKFASIFYFYLKPNSPRIAFQLLPFFFGKSGNTEK